MRLRMTLDADLCTGCKCCSTDHPVLFVTKEDGLSYVLQAGIVQPSCTEVAVELSNLHQAVHAGEHCPGEIIELFVPKIDTYLEEFSQPVQEAMATNPAEWALEASYGLTGHQAIKRLSPSQYSTLGVCIAAAAEFNNQPGVQVFSLQGFLLKRRAINVATHWNTQSIESLLGINDRVSYLLELVQIGIVERTRNPAINLFCLSEYGKKCAAAYGLYYVHLPVNSSSE